MTAEQLTEQIIENKSIVAALNESLKSAHKRIDENDQITASIHKLASNVESLALQVKLLTESMERSIMKLEMGLKNQGERIGALEKEPAEKWKALVKQVIGLVVAAIGGALLAKFM